MFVLSANIWFTKLMKQFFFGIDSIVYNFISEIYDLLIAIARTSVLSQSDIIGMTDKIYKLLAVFMIFKVTLSLITYVVNPDDFSAKGKGLSKLSANIIISLSLLILTPYIFNMVYELQTYILEDNSLAYLIFEDETNTSASTSKKSFINTAGDDIAFITMSAFFTPNVSISELQECVNLTSREQIGDELVNKVNENCTGVTKDDNGAYNVDSNNLNSMAGLLSDDDIVINYVAGIENGSLGLMFRQDLATAVTEDNEFIMDYKFIFSTVVGVVVVLLLISFCMDVAVRSIKLAFLQLIAPIPILSFIDPKSGKDGIFKKWYQLCFKTYLSLFIRLLALYFAVYIISKVADGRLVDIVDGSTKSNMLISVFIIIGALMFAKQLPEILKGLGINLDSGSFTLNPLKKIEKDAIGGSLLKKPNDMLAKAGKGILKAPLSGASTVGKKFIGGLDAARNGKGFKQGWNRTHGKLHNNFYKKLDEWAPDSAEVRKNERLGREEVKQMNTKWTKGKKAADKLYDYAKNNGIEVGKPFDLLDGKNESAYGVVYSDKAFIASRMNLDAADAKRKLLQNISDSAMRGIKITDAINSLDIQGKLDALTQRDKEEIIKLSKLPEATQSTNLNTLLENTSKQVSGMEKVHESIRKQNPSDAAIEDQLKFVKYNPTDPTDPSNEDRSAEWKEESTDTSEINLRTIVDDVTGVSRTSTVAMKAFDPNNSALDAKINAEMSEEEKQRRINIDEIMTEIKIQITKLEDERKNVTNDATTYMELTQKINRLQQELETLRRQL